LEESDTESACGSLNAFTKKVEKDVEEGILSEFQGQALLDSANEIEDILGCT
jgi:hypothetical protein